MRIGIWFQGCSIGCRGCLSTDTWPSDQGTEIELDELLAWCRPLISDVDGVTISGGEPFEQPEALRALLENLRGWQAAGTTSESLDLLCYSGLPISALKADFAGHLRLLDAIIPEPFLVQAPTTKEWRGSRNQPLVPLSDRGHKKYQRYVDAVRSEPALQVTVTEDEVWYIGIPGRGDLDRMEDALKAKGVALTGVSWKTPPRSTPKITSTDRPTGAPPPSGSAR